MRRLKRKKKRERERERAHLSFFLGPALSDEDATRMKRKTSDGGCDWDKCLHSAYSICPSPQMHEKERSWSLFFSLVRLMTGTLWGRRRRNWTHENIERGERRRGAESMLQESLSYRIIEPGLHSPRSPVLSISF